MCEIAFGLCLSEMDAENAKITIYKVTYNLL